MVTAIVTLISLVLMISGMVLKNTLLLLASTITWIIFAFLMYEYTFTNTAINTGLLIFGGVMAIICAVSALPIFMSKRPHKMSLDDEQKSYRREVLRTTKKKR